MAMNSEWLDWTRTNLKRGSAPSEVRNILKNNGFSDKDIKFAFKRALPAGSYKQTLKSAEAELKDAGRNSEANYAELAKPRLVRQAGTDGIECVMEGDFQLYTIPNFLSDEQCDGMVEIVSANTTPSTVATNSEQNQERTSSTCYLGASEHPLVAEIDEKIAATLGINLAWSEPNQGQWYEAGQEYKPHHDYFDPCTDSYARFASKHGQRTWTFMIYLNSTESGGGTRFTQIDKTFMPERGRAICWNSLDAEGKPNPLSEHCGMPVESGTKFILTKWFRDRGNGPALIG